MMQSTTRLDANVCLPTSTARKTASKKLASASSDYNSLSCRVMHAVEALKNVVSNVTACMHLILVLLFTSSMLSTFWCRGHSMRLVASCPTFKNVSARETHGGWCLKLATHL